MSRDVLAVDASRSSTRARTGTEWYSYELINALANLDDRPDLLLYERWSPNSPSPHGSLRSRDSRRVIHSRRLWTHAGMSLAVARDRPRALFVPSHVVPLIHPRESVVTIHDLGYRHEPQAHTRASRHTLELSTRWNAAVARKIIAVSEQTRRDLTSAYGVAASKICVVHSGINHSRFRPVDSVDVLRKYGITKPYIFFLSTVQPRKNVTRLVEAFETLDTDVSMVIAGRPGWLSEAIEGRIQSSPASHRINRLGFVADEDIPALYSGAAVFALPSLYEGFGMGILEAMACGCPVVTSNCSSMPEVADGAAILVDPFSVASIRDGLLEALDESRNVELKQLGAARVRRSTWDLTAQQSLAVISSAKAPVRRLE